MSTTYAQRQTAAQKKDASNAASVLDSSSQRESLQRKADMANNAVQRVVPKMGGVIQKKIEKESEIFDYDDDLKNKENTKGTISNPLGYESDKIKFCKYMNKECFSSGFTGCLMMAFKFIKDEMDGESWNGLFSGKKHPENLSINEICIAHVYVGNKNQALEGLYNAKTNGWIEILTLFKPNTVSRVNQGFAGGFDGSVMGGLKEESGRWIASVYVPETKSRGYNSSKKETGVEDGVDLGNSFSYARKSFENKELEKQEDATRAFVYASIGKYDKMNEILKNKDSEFFDVFFDICSMNVLENLKNELPNKANVIQKKINQLNSLLKSKSKCCTLL